jgi:hypothetical protein
MAEESFGWGIWTTGANAILVFLYVLSISIAYAAGGYILNPLVLAAIAFLIPYFSFWVLPFLLIVAVAVTNRLLIR